MKECKKTENKTKISYNISFATSNDNIANAKIFKEKNTMAKNVEPEAKDALNRFKMEAANEVGVPRPS